MTKRKKRLEKGIKSLTEQIDIHEEKRENALGEGKIELAEYYSGEILKFKKDQNKKKSYLKK